MTFQGHKQYIDLAHRFKAIALSFDVIVSWQNEGKNSFTNM